MSKNTNNKIWLITKREYFTRVRNKTFLLSTFLLPLMIILFIAGSVIVASQGKSRYRVAVVRRHGCAVRWPGVISGRRGRIRVRRAVWIRGQQPAADTADGSGRASLRA